MSERGLKEMKLSVPLKPIRVTGVGVGLVVGIEVEGEISVEVTVGTIVIGLDISVEII